MQESLEQAIARVGSAVEVLRNSQATPFAFPVPPEFSNWRSEQQAWRESCALLDQSHHMCDLFIDGPEALKLFSHLGVNNFANFPVSSAKQLVTANGDGKFIGDGILFRLGEESFDLVGGPTLVDWVQHNLEAGKVDASCERDETSVNRSGPPKLYRYELQGPEALALMEDLTGKPVPEVKFFHIAEFDIAGHRVRALRHGMAGQPGFELFGPWGESEGVLGAILAAGERHGLRRAGAKAYSTANLESGWIPTPLPAVYSGDGLRPFRQGRSVERGGSLAGSFYSAEIEDYYLTPYDLGYKRLISFEHDFVGREALQAMAKEPSLAKVTLVWNQEDVEKAVGSLLQEKVHAKFMDFPKCRYGYFQVDEVRQGGRRVGFSLDCGYIYNERAMISLATLDQAVSAPGTEVAVVWGEEPNSAKPAVEPHGQVEIRAIVAPAPYVEFARSTYRAGAGRAS